MPRTNLPIGTWGKIRRSQVGIGRCCARANFRDHDGVTRKVEAWGKTGAAAERRLLDKLRDRAAVGGGDIHRDTRISRLAEAWLEDIIEEGRLAPQTIDRYRDSVNGAILPALGNLRLYEASVVSRLDQFLKLIARDHPSKARHAKNVLGQMYGFAVRHDALPTNPVREVGRLRKQRRHIRALTVEDLEKVRAAIGRWLTPTPGKPGPRRRNDLAEIIDILLATGARIGEILALRWSDLNLSAPRPTATISGTLVYVKGGETFRQDWTKGDTGYRTVYLPRFAVDLFTRKINTTGVEAVFPSRKGTWLAPSSVRRQWRQARKDAGLEWVTPHTFRRTVATLIDQQVDTKAAAAQLGHVNENITTTYYVAKTHVAPDVGDVLDKLGPSQVPPSRLDDCVRPAIGTPAVGGR